MAYPETGLGRYEELTPADILAMEACARQAEVRKNTDPETLATSDASEITEAFDNEWAYLYKHPGTERHSEQRHFVTAEDDLHKKTLLHLLKNIGAFQTLDDAKNHLNTVTQAAVDEAYSKRDDPQAVPMIVEHLTTESTAAPDTIAIMTRHLFAYDEDLPDVVGLFADEDLPNRNGLTHSISIEPQLSNLINQAKPSILRQPSGLLTFIRQVFRA